MRIVSHVGVDEFNDSEVRNDEDELSIFDIEEGFVLTVE
jgi:hypothetical protein